jgi:hypothetical protein
LQISCRSEQPLAQLSFFRVPVDLGRPLSLLLGLLLRAPLLAGLVLSDELQQDFLGGGPPLMAFFIIRIANSSPCVLLTTFPPMLAGTVL